MEKILVKNATIIDSGTRREADILINDGVIEKIARLLPAPRNAPE